MPQDTYKIIAAAKTNAGLALATAFTKLKGLPYSEQDLANNWLEALRDYADFYSAGWYEPPPNGIISVFGGSADRYQRLCQPSFRPIGMWPSSRCYRADDILALYASPLHRLNLMGDFGLSLYFGDDAQIHSHFEKVLKTTLSIAHATKVGMSFKEMYAIAMNVGAQEGLTNNIESSTDRAGTNIGHTIPLSYASDPTNGAIAGMTSFAEIKKVLSSGRKFINSQEIQRVEENIAFTIEPRFSGASMPNAWFHLTVIFEEGRRRICHGFEPLLRKTPMSTLIDLLPKD